jgi:23S rRNA pseudouridine1911/1915/1917 synthase
MATRHTFVVESADAGLRLDQVIPRHVAGLSRRRTRVLVDIGGVFVDRSRVKVASRPVRQGQTVEVNLGGALDRAGSGLGAAARERDAAELPSFRVEYQDEDVIVVDKPPGLVTAPTPESDRGNLADLLARRGGSIFVVHRIDRPTSGLLVFARTDLANRVLGKAFAAHQVEREYRAVLLGNLAGDVTVELPIAGKRAVTHLKVLERLQAMTVVSARLETGRSHQIRIHAAGLGHPVAGDHQHGAARVHAEAPRPPRLALHAAVLGFLHPRSGQPMRFTCDLPADLSGWIDGLRGQESET